MSSFNPYSKNIQWGSWLGDIGNNIMMAMLMKKMFPQGQGQPGQGQGQPMPPNVGPVPVPNMPTDQYQPKGQDQTNSLLQLLANWSRMNYPQG